MLPEQNSTISNIYMQAFTLGLHFKWKYLLCLIFTDTAFLLSTAYFSYDARDKAYKQLGPGVTKSDLIVRSLPPSVSASNSDAVSGEISEVTRMLNCTEN